MEGKMGRKAVETGFVAELCSGHKGTGKRK